MNRESTVKINQSKNTSLQALRALAFLGIFLSHAGSPVKWSALGVSVFFLMSGFLMFVKYYDRQLNPSMLVNLRFSINKMKALYPLHILTMIMAIFIAIIQLAAKGWSFKSLLYLLIKIICNVFLIQAWVPTTTVNVSLNGVTWYLSVILFLYFCFPWILNQLKKIKSTKEILIIVISIIFLQISFLAIMINFHGFDGTQYVWSMYCFPVFRLGDFIIGCNLGYLFYKKNFLRNISFSQGTLLEMFAIGITAMLFWFEKQKAPNLFMELWHNWTTIYILVASIWVYLFAINKGLVTSLFTNKLSIYIGNISAYLFLIHYVIIQYTSFILSLLNLKPRNVIMSIIIIVEFGLTILCTIGYIRIENYIKKDCKNSKCNIKTYQ